MKRSLVLVFALTALTGCNFGGGNANQNSNANSATAGKEADSAKPAVGGTVVAKWAQNAFYEGTVESLTDSKAKIKWSDGSSPSEVDLSEVYAIPKAGTKTNAAVGDMVVARTNPSGSSWSGAQVKTAGGDVVEVTLTSGGSSANVASDKVIKLSAVSAADLKTQMGSTDFLKLAQTKRPAAPEGYKPKAGDDVLAEWVTKSWYEGRVQKVSGGKVTVAWKDQSTPSDVNLTAVLPLPTAGAAKAPQSDQYLLVKPQAGSRWEYGQTVSVSGTSVEAKTSGGQTRSLKAGEYVPLN